VISARVALRRSGLVARRAPTRRMELAALIAGLTTVVAWGSAFVAIRAAGETFSPGAMALGRLLVAAAILGGIALARHLCGRRESLPGRRDVLAIGGYAVLWLCCYSIALNAAERSVDAGTAAIVINTGPLLIAVLAGVFLREGYPRGLLVGCVLAFAGTVLIGAATSGGPAGATATGFALLVLAVLAYAAAVIVQKPVLSRVSGFQVTWLGTAIATVVLLPLTPSLVSELHHANVAALGWMIYLGVVPTTLGFATWSFALRHASAGRTAALNYLIPVVAITLGWLVLGEPPPDLAVAGGALCLAGVFLARRPRSP
jgi:drug/metabolite transporter (DMT)-like permease